MTDIQPTPGPGGLALARPAVARITLQPPVAASGIAWLNRIMRARRLDTWAEAAELVIGRIAADPADPVNARKFAQRDMPRPRRFITGWDHRAGHAIRFHPDTTLCLRLPVEVVAHLRALTGLEATPAAATILAAAPRLDPSARRYLPEARS